MERNRRKARIPGRPSFWVLLALLLGGGAFWALRGGLPGEDSPPIPGVRGEAPEEGLGAERAGNPEEASSPGALPARRRGSGAAGARIRGRVLALGTKRPLAGIEVRALDRPPSFARIEVGIRDLLRKGFWEPRPEPPAVRVLARTTSGPEGVYELRGLPPGRVFLDAGGRGVFLRAPRAVRLVRDEPRDGVDLLLDRGARLLGRILAADGTAVAGARVVLRPGANAFLAQLASGSYRWVETRSDEEGRFVFPGVPPGRGYAVTALPSGFAPATRRGLVLEPGGEIHVLLRPGAGGTLRGRVRDSQGRPLPGALVGYVYLDLERALFSLGPSNPVAAGEGGRFEIPNVGRGPIAVAGLARGRGLSEPRKLLVPEAGAVEVDLVLPRGEVLRGRVVGASGKPLPGVRVAARPMDPPRGVDFADLLRLRRVETRSGPDGGFRLEGIQGTRLFLTGEKRGYLEGRLQCRRGKKGWPEVELRMDRGRWITGRVLDERGAPVPRFRLWAQPSGKGRLPIGPRWGRPARSVNPYTDRSPWSRGREDEIQDAEGRFRLGPLPREVLELRVAAEGFLEVRKKVPAGDSTEVEIRLRPGFRLEGRVLASGKGLAQAQVTWRPPGRRRSPSLLPFRIEAEPEDLDLMSFSSVLSARSVLSGPDGRFVLEGLPRGRLRITARHPRWAKASKVVELPAKGPLILELGSGGGIEGRVTGFDGRPLEGAMVLALSVAKGVLRSAVTDERGFYRIERLVPGPYLVAKSRVDVKIADPMASFVGALRVKAARVREGRWTRLDLKDRSEAGVDLFGRVLEGGRPLPRAVVSFLGQDREGPLGVGFRTATADDRGDYECRSLPPGRYLVRITKYGGGRPIGAMRSLVVPRGPRRLRKDLAFPGGRLAGRVVDSEGRPLPGVRVRALPEDGGGPGGLVGLLRGFGIQGRATSRADGSFEIRRLSAGRWKLAAEPRGRVADRWGETTLEGILLDAGGEREGLVLRLPPAGVLRGRILDGRGLPVGGATVRVLPGTGSEGTGTWSPAAARGGTAELADRLRRGLRRTTRSDASGRFRVRGLPPGSWRIEVEHRDLAQAEAVQAVLRPGENPEIRVPVVRGGRVRVRVLDRDGRPFPPGSVRVLDERGRVVGRRSLSAIFRSLLGGKGGGNGASPWIDLGTLAPGAYTLEVRHLDAEGRRITKRVRRRLAEGERASWELRWKDLVGGKPFEAPGGGQGRK